MCVCVCVCVESSKTLSLIVLFMYPPPPPSLPSPYLFLQVPELIRGVMSAALMLMVKERLTATIKAAILRR